jgi:uncharacterized protein YndB with AHSA1/START domain
MQPQNQNTDHVCLKHLIEIDASINSVYSAITTQESLAAWWTETAVARPVEGTISEFTFNSGAFNKMKVVRLENPKKVMWECVDGAEEWIGTKIMFRLEEKQGQTILRFMHSEWREASDFFAMCNSIWAHYLTSLKAFCETGKGTPHQAN